MGKKLEIYLKGRMDGSCLIGWDEKGGTIKPSQFSDLDLWIDNIVINHDGE